MKVGGEDAARARSAARERRRMARIMMLRSAIVSALVLGGYFWLPMSGWRDTRLAVQLVGGSVLLVGLLSWQIHEIARSPYPQIRALGAVTTSFTVFLTTFATVYYLMSSASDANWSEPLSRLDAMYFTVTVLATVGFGDITAVDPAARAVVTLQMIGDLVIIGVVVRLIMRAVERGEKRRQHTSESDPRQIDEDRW